MQHEAVVRNVQDGAGPPPDGARTTVAIHLADPTRQHEGDLAQAWRVLNTEERSRALGFQLEPDRRIYVVAHALLRYVVAGQIGADAGDLRFCRTHHGRPELEGRGGADGVHANVNVNVNVRFNLSHTRGLVGCAVTRAGEVGFDVEEARQPAPLELAPRYFSRAELDDLKAAPPAERSDRFYTLWTLKEAYIKARGLGLAIPLESFSCIPGSRGRAHLARERPHDGVEDLLAGRSDGGADDDAAPWTLRWWRFDRHAAALAIHAPGVQVRVAIAADVRIEALAGHRGNRG